MRAIDYIRLYYPEAKKVENETGISAAAMIAQSAGESGWRIAPGNAMFGIKDTDGLNGNEQLLRTKEYHSRANVKYPKIYSISPVMKGDVQMYKYDCDAWFRKYDTVADSFRDYAKFIFKNPRYKKALLVKDNPKLYLKEIARAGYATGLNYEAYLIQMLRSVEKRLKLLNM